MRAFKRRAIGWALWGSFLLLLSAGCTSTSMQVVQGGGGGVELGPVEIELRSHGRRLPCFVSHGNFYVVGYRGMPYSIWIRNRTPSRLEVVAAVDGRDVINGRRRSLSYRGYILNPYRFVNITGYRTSMRTVAGFRFSAIHRSYSARRGSSWFRVGTIHISVFRERGRPMVGGALLQRNHRYFSSRYRSPNIMRKKSYPASPPRSSGSYKRLTRRRVTRRYIAPQRRYAPAPRRGLGGPRIVRKAPPSVGGKSLGLDNDSMTRQAPRRPSFRSRRARPARPDGRYGSHGFRYPRPREGLGTAYGRRRYAPAQYTTFYRASSRPSYSLLLHYNNCAGYRRMKLCTPWCPCYTRPAPRPYLSKAP